MNLNPVIFRSWIGNAQNEDGVFRNILNMSLRQTGADLFSVALDSSIKELLKDTTKTAQELALVAYNGISSQILENGEVIAAVDASPPDQWHKYGYLKQGHTAAAAIIAEKAGKSDIAKKIIDNLAMQQEDRYGPRIRGLWPYGVRIRKINPDTKVNPDLSWEEWWAIANDYMYSPSIEWVGSWEYCNSHTYGFEDRTAVANACAMYAFGKTSNFDAALDAMELVAKRNNGAIPYACDNKGLPKWARSVSPPAYSTEETGAVCILARAAGRTALADMTMAWLESVKLHGGIWPGFICPKTGRAIYPKGDKAKNYSSGLELGETTYNYSESVTGGFNATTNAPIMAYYSYEQTTTGYIQKAVPAIF